MKIKLTLLLILICSLCSVHADYQCGYVNNNLSDILPVGTPMIINSVLIPNPGISGGIGLSGEIGFNQTGKISGRGVLYIYNGSSPTAAIKVFNVVNSYAQGRVFFEYFTPSTNYYTNNLGYSSNPVYQVVSNYIYSWQYSAECSLNGTAGSDGFESSGRLFTEASVSITKAPTVYVPQYNYTNPGYTNSSTNYSSHIELLGTDSSGQYSGVIKAGNL